MKTYTEEIEALKQIKHTPEEMEEISRISNRIKEIDARLKAIDKEQRELYEKHHDSYSIIKRSEYENKNSELNEELRKLREEKNDLYRNQQNIFDVIRNKNIEVESQKQREYSEELEQIRIRKQYAVNTVDKKAFDKLDAREKEVEAMKAESKAKIEDYSAAKSEIEIKIEQLRKEIDKETASEVLNHINALQQIFDARKAELEQIMAIQKKFDLSDQENEKYSAWGTIEHWKLDTLNIITDILEKAEKHSDKLHEMASYEE